MTLLLAFNFNIIEPLVKALEFLITWTDGYTHNLGWSLIVLAVMIRAVFWPLNTMQFSSMTKMQQLQPQLKVIQEKYKNDPQRLNAEMMGLYKEHGTSPFASCLPLVLQLPILISVYQAITSLHEKFMQTHWGWIGSDFAAHYPNILASNLAAPDYALLAVYVASMYISIRFSSPPSSDPQQAQTQQIMAIVSPLMIAWIGRTWPSGLLLFWFTSNVIQTLQQLYLRKLAPQIVLEGSPNGVALNGSAVRPASPNRDAAHSSRRPRKGPRRSSR